MNSKADREQNSKEEKGAAWQSENKNIECLMWCFDDRI